MALSANQLSSPRAAANQRGLQSISLKSRLMQSYWIDSNNRFQKILQKQNCKDLLLLAHKMQFWSELPNEQSDRPLWGTGFCTFLPNAFLEALHGHSWQGSSYSNFDHAQDMNPKNPFVSILIYGFGDVRF